MGIDAELLIRGVSTELVTDEWLEQNIPGCKVWYGGDSSGVEAELFTPELRALLITYMNGPNGQDYYNKRWPGDNPKVKPPPCGMCPDGKYRGRRFGSGLDYSAYYCPGCGKSVETCDNGVTWTEKKDTW